MVRSIHILRTSAPPFKDHWGLWLPSTKDENIGTVIEVQGGVHSGFEQLITRNYNYAASNRPARLTFLGNVEDVHVLDPPDSDGGVEVIDTQARDEVERCALSIPPPGPSMNSTERDVVSLGSLDCYGFVCLGPFEY